MSLLAIKFVERYSMHAQFHTWNSSYLEVNSAVGFLQRELKEEGICINKFRYIQRKSSNLLPVSISKETRPMKLELWHRKRDVGIDGS